MKIYSDFIDIPDAIIEDSLSNNKELVLFFDFKNFFRSFFVEEVVSNILLENIHGEYVTTVPTQIVLNTVSKYKSLIRSRGIDKYRIIIFDSEGNSIYHKNIFSRYKENREIGRIIYTGTETEEELLKKQKLEEKIKTKKIFNYIRRKNIDSVEYILKRIRNIRYIRLINLESDFIPYFLINYYFKKDFVESCNFVIFSNDHDMFQCLFLKNIFQIYKSSGGVVTLNSDNVFNNFLKTYNIKDQNLNLNHEYFPVIFSMTGDSIDGIPGLKGIGPATAIKILKDKETENVIGTPEDVFQSVFRKNKFLKYEAEPDNKDSLWYKKIFSNYKFEDVEDILCRNYKLVSFRFLSEWLNERNSTSKNDFYKEIVSCMEKEYDYLDWEDIFESLKELGNVYITEDCIKSCVVY